MQQLLADAVSPSGDRLPRAGERIISGEWLAYTCQLDGGGEVLGVIVAEEGHETLTIQIISVAPEHRCRGVGRHMVEMLHARNRNRWLMAETDDDAVGFYRALDFTVEPLGERYPGVPRFRCMRPAP